MRDQQMESWLCGHVHAFEHFHGIPALAVRDNTRTGVTRAHRYDPDLNPTYYNFAQHCGFGIVPPRPRKPRELKPRSKTPCKWRNAGSWRRSDTASSFRSRN
jgi:transposase